MATQEERKKATRAKLVAAARRLFESDGFDVTTVDRIVETANLAKGTFYQHFDTKLDVVLAMARDDLAELAPRVLRSLERGDDPEEVLRGLLKTMCDWFQDNPSLASAVITHGFATGDTSSRSRDPNTSTRGLIEAVVAEGQRRGTIRDDVKAHELAEMISGVYLQAVFGWSRSARTKRLWPWVRRFLDVWMEGAGR